MAKKIENQGRTAGRADEDMLEARQDDASEKKQSKGKTRQNRGNRARKTEPETNDETPQVIEIRPMARQASMRKRHWGLVFGFFLLVILPLGGVGYYLAERATDQYASIAGFTVRQEESGSSAAMLGGLSQFVGGSSSSDADMLYEYLRSQDLVVAVNERLDLRAHYSVAYKVDPVFALKPDSTTEELVDYWKKIVLVSYDQNSGLINLTALAFDPETARDLAVAILEESQKLMNELNAKARSDSLKYAEEDLQEAVSRLKSAREALVRFRTRTQIVDPESDLRGRMGVLTSLQQQLAQAMIDYDIVAQDSGPEDPRVVQALRRIEVIRKRLAAERSDFAEENAEGTEEAYPALMAEYESLTVDREFAEESYRITLATLDSARANAVRQSRYLSTYVQPTLPETAEFPRKLIIFALSGVFFLLLWVILSLMYYAVRDRK